MIDWIIKGFKFLKIGWGILAPYRLWAGLAVAGTALITILVFYGNCRACSASQKALQVQIAQYEVQLSSFRVELNKRNERIQNMNARKREELATAEIKLQEALAAAAAIRDERDTVKEKLEVTRFELLETIRDDEDFADWVDWGVPSGAWSLLQQTADSGTR